MQIEKDKWIEISRDTKKGTKEEVYRPSNYPGPIAVDAKPPIKK